MEAAGLAVGVLSVANLCSACLDAFHMIGTARDAGIDFELLSIRLDIEKTRLLQWTEGVGLLSPDVSDQNPSLISESVQPQLERILKAIQMILTKSEDLNSSYGLVWDPSSTDNEVMVISSRRADAFEQNIDPNQRRGIGLSRRKRVGPTAKWVVKDRESFSKLLDNLHILVDSLYDLVVVPKTFQRLMIKEDVEGLGNDLSTLRKLQIAGVGQRNDWSDCAMSRIAASQADSHDFRTIDEWLQDMDPVAAHGSAVRGDSTGIVVQQRAVSNNMTEEPSALTKSREEQLPKIIQDDAYSLSSTIGGQAWNDSVSVDGRQGFYGPRSTFNSFHRQDSEAASLTTLTNNLSIANMPRLDLEDCIARLSSSDYQKEVRPFSRDQMLDFLGMLDCILGSETGSARRLLPMLGPNHLRRGRSTVLLQQVQALKRIVPNYNESVTTDYTQFDKPSEPMKFQLKLDGKRRITVTRSFRRLIQAPRAGPGMKRVLWAIVYSAGDGEGVSHFWLLEHVHDDWIVRGLPSRSVGSSALSAVGKSAFGWLTV